MHSSHPSHGIRLLVRSLLTVSHFILLLCGVAPILPQAACGATYGDYTIVQTTTVTKLDGSAITDRGGGLAFDGTNLWYTTKTNAANAGLLYRIDPDTQTITAAWSTAFTPAGIAWDGSHLQVVDANAPTVHGFDLNGHEVGSQDVAASDSYFHGLAWDGSHLWGGQDWLLLKFDENGNAIQVHSTSWLGPYAGLTWDGARIVAVVDISGWTSAYGVYTIRIDPLTGNASDFRHVGTNTGSTDLHHIAIGSGRMWIIRGSGIDTQLYEVTLPSDSPFPALNPAFGVFTVLDGFAVPQRSTFLTGCALGAHGSDFWYGDYFNISKVNWSDHSTNTAALDRNWPIAGGSTLDITSDGTRVWMTNYGSQPAGYRVYELSLTGDIVRSFPLPLDSPEGLAWDGQALWVAANHSETSGNVLYFSRYTPDGQLLKGPTAVATDEFQLNANDLAWHDGKLWVLSSSEGTDSSGNYGSITSFDPATGATLGRYKTGGLNSWTGLASDGANLWVVAQPRRVNGIVGPPGAIFPMIARLQMPVDLTPPTIASATSTASQIQLQFTEKMVYYSQTSHFSLECPPGTPIDLASATVTTDFASKMTIAGLSLPANTPYSLSIHFLRDTTGNIIRQDGVGNVVSGTVGGLTAPVALVANESLPNRVTLTWFDGSTGETGFRIERSAEGGDWVQLADFLSTTGATSGTQQSYTDSNVTPGANYTYRMVSYDAANVSPYSNLASYSLHDTDGDGLSDQYELSVSHTNSIVRDTDADGASDYSEVISGTDPNNPSSVFKVSEAILSEDRHVTLRWNGVTGKSYRIARSTTLDFSSSDIIATHILGIAPTTSFTDPSTIPDAPSHAFYRIELE